MVGKTLYIHFENQDYIDSKSGLLKIQMDILYLKKVLKDLLLTREKKIHYQQMLFSVFANLKQSIERLDNLMPEDEEISKIKTNLKEKIEKKTKSKKENKKKIIKKEEVVEPDKREVVVRKDDIEEELLKIKQKLDMLNRQ